MRQFGVGSFFLGESNRSFIISHLIFLIKNNLLQTFWLRGAPFGYVPFLDFLIPPASAEFTYC